MARHQPRAAVFLYDVWTSAPRTQRGHLSHPVSVNVHQAPQREDVRWMVSYPGRRPSRPDATLTDTDAPGWTDELERHEEANTRTQEVIWRKRSTSLVFVFTGLDTKLKRFPRSKRAPAGERRLRPLDRCWDSAAVHRKSSRPLEDPSQTRAGKTSGKQQRKSHKRLCMSHWAWRSKDLDTTGYWKCRTTSYHFGLINILRKTFSSIISY